MPELPTTTATEPQSKRESRAARLLAVLMDYAAGTADSIRTRYHRAADRIGRAARRFGAAALLLLVRVLFMVVGLSSGLAVMFGAALVIPEVTPDGFASALLLRLPAMAAAVGLWGIAYSWTVQHAMPDSLRRFIMYGHK